MPQKLLNKLHVHTLPAQQRGVRVMKIVDSEGAGQAGVIKHPLEVASFERRTDPRGKHEAVLVPQGA